MDFFGIATGRVEKGPSARCDEGEQRSLLVGK
jgi:hypothetical protein